MVRSRCRQAIERIEHLLVTNEFSDRVYDLRDGDTKKVRNLLAYRKVGVEGQTEEFWVPPTVFDKEFVVGVNKAELVKELSKRGWLYLGEEVFKVMLVAVTNLFPVVAVTAVTQYHPIGDSGTEL
jgi:hypothetical protein